MSVTKLSGQTLLAIASGDLGVLSPRVASLAAAMTRASSVAKLKLVSALLVSAGLVVGLIQQVIGQPGVSDRPIGDGRTRTGTASPGRQNLSQKLTTRRCRFDHL